MSSEPTKFLTAEWRSLLMLNFEIDPDVLEPFVPKGVELDPFEGRHYVSMVGFRFLSTKLLGVPIPFHRDFDEINLRFYVRRQTPEGWRRGVTFIKEIVPRSAVSFVARTFYNENYVTKSMRSQVGDPPTAGAGVVKYEWHDAHRWNCLAGKIVGEPYLPASDSEASYIIEHYFGYTKQNSHATAEYKVEHPPWKVWNASNVEWDCDIREVYGDAFVSTLSKPPRSALVAAGSPVSVRWGQRVS